VSHHSADTKIKSREQLVCVLHMASRLEHLLACQYLFAAFTLRKDLRDFPAGGNENAKRLVMARNQRWGYKIMEIARQEMEHLGIVNNLLAALGEEPFFDRPNFPVPRSYLPIDAPFVLQKFGQTTLERFLAYERPGYLKVPDEWPAGGPPDCCIDSLHCDGIVFRDVQELYNEIKTAFQNLDPETIFRGDTERQVDVTDAGVVSGLGVTMEPVTDRISANTAIGLILEQGEGVGDYPLSPQSHFGSFSQILREYLDAGSASKYEAALPVVDNPLLHKHSKCSEAATIVTHPYTRQAMELFNHSYGILLVCLKQFFKTFRSYAGYPSVTAGFEPLSELQRRMRNAALMEIAFFPFMTMVIRPLGELLTRLPALDGQDEPLAGPSYEIADGRVPHVDPETLPSVLRKLANECWKLAESAPDERRRIKVGHIAENMTRMQQNFERVWNAVQLPEQP